MSKSNVCNKKLNDNDQSVQELIWAIKMSEGQFSLILALCNYLPLQKQIGESLYKLPSVQIRKVFLDTSVKTLYSTIQKQLKDEQPSAVMVFGLESVKDIDRLIISANTNFLNVCYISLYPPLPTLPTPPTLLSTIICSKDKLNWYQRSGVRG